MDGAATRIAKKAGDCCWLPADTVHDATVPGSKILKMLVFM
jgi:hypothetical protein